MPVSVPRTKFYPATADCARSAFKALCHSTTLARFYERSKSHEADTATSLIRACKFTERPDRPSSSIHPPTTESMSYDRYRKPDFSWLAKPTLAMCIARRARESNLRRPCIAERNLRFPLISGGKHALVPIAYRDTLILIRLVLI